MTNTTKAAGNTKTIKKWQQPALALGIVLAFMVLVQLTYGIRYEVNDDAIISNIAGGAYGGSTWRLVYVNVLLGFFLKPFYTLLPGLNWFVVGMLVVAAIAFAALGTLLLRRLGTLRGVLLFAVLLALGGYDLFTRIHYVKFGGLYITAGFILLWAGLGQVRAKTLLGGALVLLGTLLRFDMLPAVGALALGLLIERFIALPKPQRKTVVATAAVLVAAVLLAQITDWAAYRGDEAWAYYTRYNAARTEVSDFKFQYATPEDLAALGYSQNDYDIINEWAYYDPEVFGLEAVEALADALPGNTVATALRGTAYHLGRVLHTKPVHILLALVLLGWLFLSAKKRWPVLVYTAAAFVAEVFYLNMRGRYIQRIDGILVLCAALLLALCFEGGQKLKPRWLALAGISVVLALLPIYAADLASRIDYELSRPALAAQYDALSADKEHLYLLGTVDVDAASGISVWRTRPKEYFSNIVFVGSWFMYSPPQQEALAAYEVTNPYADSIDNPRVLYGEYYLRQIKETYLQEHYNPAVRLEKLEDGHQLNIYRATTEGD